MRVWERQREGLLALHEVQQYSRMSMLSHAPACASSSHPLNLRPQYPQQLSSAYLAACFWWLLQACQAMPSEPAAGSGLREEAVVCWRRWLRRGGGVLRRGGCRREALQEDGAVAVVVGGACEGHASRMRGGCDVPAVLAHGGRAVRRDAVRRAVRAHVVLALPLVVRAHEVLTRPLLVPGISRRWRRLHHADQRQRKV